MSDLNKLHIFLAEDDHDDSFLFREAITQLASEASVTIAEDGVSFMECLAGSAEVPDIIFLDVNMPLKNGLECLYDIRAARKYDEVPVVFLSTSVDKSLLDSAYDGGANLYVQKPPSFKNLKKVIEQCLKSKIDIVPPPVREEFLLVNN